MEVVMEQQEVDFFVVEAKMDLPGILVVPHEQSPQALHRNLAALRLGPRLLFRTLCVCGVRRRRHRPTMQD